MPEVLRLQIVYETSQALSGANRLATATGNLTGEQKKSSIAALHLAQALSEGNISAVTMARSVEHLGGALGGIATAVGLAAGLFVLWLHRTEDLEKRTAELAKEVETARRALDKLLGIKTSDAQTQIQGLTDRIKELQKELDKPSIWQRFLQFLKQIPEHFGGMHTPPPKKSPILQAKEDLEALEVVAKRVAASDLAIALGQVPAGVRTLQFHPTTPAGAAFNRPIQFHPAAGGPSFGADLSGLTPHPGIPSGDTAVLEITRQQERLVHSWEDGLHAMQDAVNEFLVTGKFAIQDLINTFLSIAFRAASEGFIEASVNKTIDRLAHSNAAKRLVGGKT
jgi:hypothetical protein